MLGGVVQHVGEHLLEPLGVAGDGLLEQLAAALVFQGDAVLPEQLPVGVDGVFKLRLQVHGFHPQREAAVLHLGELQQLLHHVGKAAGLLEDDAQAAVELPGIAAAVG